MKLSKLEIIGFGVSASLMALALFFVRWQGTLDSDRSLVRSVEEAGDQTASVIVAENSTEGLAKGLNQAMTGSKVNKLVTTDVTLGTGEEVEKGDEVEVHYVGTLQNGQEFDNSYKKGSSFSFTVGEGKVIEGWEKGVLGMKTGGERILVIPASMAYGKEGYGPIPGNATLVFAIELISIK